MGTEGARIETGLGETFWVKYPSKVPAQDVWKQKIINKEIIKALIRSKKAFAVAPTITQPKRVILPKDFFIKPPSTLFATGQEASLMAYLGTGSKAFNVGLIPLSAFGDKSIIDVANKTRQEPVLKAISKPLSKTSF